MHVSPPLALLDQWVSAYEDHQSMMDHPKAHHQMLDELASEMADTGVIERRLHRELLKKSALAYEWAVEFSVARDSRPN